MPQTELSFYARYRKMFPEERVLTSWDIKHLNKAEFVSRNSKDPSTKVGAVITTMSNRPVSEGYNGLPQRVADTQERLNNRELKYKMIIHGELNALIFAQRDVTNCKLYTYPFMPCSVCAGIMIQAGISDVIAPYSDNPRWADMFQLSLEMFHEAGVTLFLVKPEQWSPK